MNKIFKKSISLLLILLCITSVIYIVNVYAEDNNDNQNNEELVTVDPSASDECKAHIKDHENTYNTLYGMSIDYNGGDKMIISMTVPSSNDSIYIKDHKGEVKFHITKIELRDIIPSTTKNDPSRVTYDYGKEHNLKDLGITEKSELTYSNDLVIHPINNNPYRYRVYLEPYNYVDSELRKKCGENATFKAYLEYAFDGKPLKINENFTIDYGNDTMTIGELNCNDQLNENSSEYKFCQAKKAAEASGVKKITYTKDNNTYSKKFGSKNSEKLSCNPFDIIKQTDENIADDLKYYLNKNYYFGTITHTISDQKYTYNYGGQVESTGISKDTKNQKTESVNCKVKCEEVVTVEYGAPVASKAGLCFEYKVKVTSRVNCDMIEGPKPPSVRETSYCTPSPGCNHGNGFIDTEAGPNEEFDSCVYKCDRGKYTSKCSTKCYNEVYKKSISATKKSNNHILDYKELLEKVDDRPTYSNDTTDRNMNDDGKGRYYRENGIITWDPEYVLGRWYTENNQTRPHACTKSKNQGGGIASLCGCSAQCRWNGCEDDVYLNPGEAEKDYNKNKEIYENVKSICESYAKCSTTTAEFTISVDYTPSGSTKVKTINFPYDNKIDTIENKGDANDTVNCTVKNKNSIILKTGGCYNCGTATSNKEYLTEWSFPGTWIHNKTGEISYEPKDNGSWQELENKFCLPLTAENVNIRWYNYYYAKLYGNDSNFSYNDNDYTNNIVCPDGTHLTDISCGYRDTTFDNNDKKDLKYNIKASTRNFGLFGWNIDIKCFYAVNSEFPGGDPPCESTCEPPNNSTKYRIRTVDLTNLFPDNEGNKLPTTDVTGRTPGFNWTSYSNQIIKDPDYQSLPSNYTKWIQARGAEIYSDDYLDYEILLTKDEINKIKSKTRNYTDWQGNVEINSVTNYKSDLIRKDIKTTKYPNGQALKCNNMKNYNSSECEDFTGEVK